MKTEERKAKGLPIDNFSNPAGKPVDAANSKAVDGGDGVKPRNNAGRNNRGGQEKFNAFRELDKLRKGQTANLAPIPDEVAIVGKAIPVSVESLKRRRDDGDGDDRQAKRQQTTEVSHTSFTQRKPS